MVGLLSLTSVSFASTISYTAEYEAGSGDAQSQVASGNKAGKVTLDHTDASAVCVGNMGSWDSTTGLAGPIADSTRVSGSTNGTASVWYELVINYTGVTSWGSATNTAGSNPGLIYNFFEYLGGDGDPATTNDTDIAAHYATTSSFSTQSGNFLLNLAQGTYMLELIGEADRRYDVQVAAVPVPAAGILFASALFGAGALGRRKKKAKASVVGAFARAS